MDNRKTNEFQATVKDKKEIWDWIKAIFIAIIVAFVIRTFFFTPIVVDGDSMEPTLHNQERMIVTKLGKPQRFDIIVFHAPDGRDYIKRVIGLPGDHIEYKDDALYINGKAYAEPYLEEFKIELKDGGTLTDSFTLKETAVRSDVVPAGHLFVLGDNRRKSNDSRSIGAIPLEKVVGTTKIIFFPISDMKVIGK
ncbi:signal peptidase I [Lederbergia wuyishanensis]|uniref:Signal peptidase I n=1 Tax=Lederbergia wuyishanensis TaxID=1347903 RepID=A0ABU0D5H3_9BACI|nr:signal peptidase I [Lederbergia wuyishanensis]MCJ8009778.1 signal peptidase I [Lederbergia wuyishanensis]MDQ0343634.1 signal peptidase I [Lederbergia wuyishanensis]